MDFVCFGLVVAPMKWRRENNGHGWCLGVDIAGQFR
jgi:hypothetical protein